MTFVIECFSASGGMAEGLRRAGLPVTMAFDMNPEACASYEANHGHRPVQMDVADLLRMIRAGFALVPSPDLFVADPPCTPWSRAGKRQGLEDERDMIRETVDLVRAMRPRYFLIANVPGLDDKTNWAIVQKTIGSLEDIYCIDYASLDAADYGVPQHRVRPFWYGHPKKHPHITWPERTHGDPKVLRNGVLPGVTPLFPWVTCRQALGHLAPEDMGQPVRLRWKPRSDHRPSRHDEPAKALTGNTHSDGALVTDGRHPAHDADAPAHTIRGTAKQKNQILARVRDDGSLREHVADLPAKTIRASRSNAENMVIGSDEETLTPERAHDDVDDLIARADREIGELKELVVRERNDGRPRNASRLREHVADEPAKGISCKGSQHTMVTAVKEELLGERENGSLREHPIDEAAHTITTRSARSRLLLRNPKHLPSSADRPAKTVGAKDRSQSNVIDMVADGCHPPSRIDEPAMTVRAGCGGGSNRTIETGEWPWDRPATTVTNDERIAPPGHHEGSFLSAPEPKEAWPWASRPATTVCAGVDKIAPQKEHAAQKSPNAIKLSEKAASILQGFPDTWVFVGKAKKARWSQIGQAMPPGLAEAVARSMKKVMLLDPASAPLRMTDVPTTYPRHPRPAR